MYKANQNTILVLVSSFPYTINWSQENLPAIVHMTHCSQEMGHGLADVLTGVVNPAGRTTQTWVKDILDLPNIMDYDIRNGRTYMYQESEVLYPFGYGLSYTNFKYISATSRQDKKSITLTITIKNTGSCDGEEVIQVYASYPESAVSRPKKQLCAFARVAIAKDETKEVSLVIDKEDLSYWNESTHSFTFEKGKQIVFGIGTSSADIRIEETLLAK